MSEKIEIMGMTVGELLDALKDVDRDRVLVMQKDAEGNGYSPLHSAHVDEWYDLEEGEWVHPDDVESWEIGSSDNAKKVVLLSPIN